MIEKIPFGKTGHLSTRVIFGAAALGGMKQDKADPILDILLEFGINHIDTAAAYGDSELRIGPLSQLTRLSEPGYSTSLAIWFSLAGNVHT
jgi:aryl-alcohol dehydrogenase-like predicted oxidoreductase